MPLVHRRTPGKTLRARKAPARLSRGQEVVALDPKALAESVAACLRTVVQLEAKGDFMALAAAYLDLGDLVLRGGEVERANELYRRSLAASRRCYAPCLGV